MTEPCAPKQEPSFIEITKIDAFKNNVMSTGAFFLNIIFKIVFPLCILSVVLTLILKLVGD